MNRPYKISKEEYLVGLCIAFLGAPAGSEEEQLAGRAFRVACLRLGEDWEKVHDSIVAFYGGAVVAPDWT